jgi:hypothetical protein
MAYINADGPLPPTSFLANLFRSGDANPTQPANRPSPYEALYRRACASLVGMAVRSNQFGASVSGVKPIEVRQLTAAHRLIAAVLGWNQPHVVGMNMTAQGPEHTQGDGQAPHGPDIQGGAAGNERHIEMKGGPPRRPPSRNETERLTREVALLTRKASAAGMEDIIEDPAAVWDVVAEHGAKFREGLAEIDKRGVLDHEIMTLKFQKGLTTSSLQHVALYSANVAMLRDPGRVAETIAREYPQRSGCYFAFELNGRNAANGFVFFPYYEDARHQFMSAVAEWCGIGYDASVARSPEWLGVEDAKMQLTAQLTEMGQRAPYQTEPTPCCPPTVWSATKNMNSALSTMLRPALAGLNDEPARTEGRTWADLQRLYLERPNDLLGMAGVAMPTLGDFTDPFDPAVVDVTVSPETGTFDRLRWDVETAARLRDDPGGICFGFRALNVRAGIAPQDAEIRAIAETAGIFVPARLGTVHLLQQMGGLLLPSLASDYPNLQLDGPTLTDALISGRPTRH